MKKFLISIIAAILFTGITGCGSGSSGTSDTTSLTDTNTSLKLLIPLYIYPGTDDTSWKKIFDIQTANPSLQTVVIVNHAKGDFLESDPNYVRGISRLHEEGIIPVGYVYTDMANRDIDLVKESIDRWADTYKNNGLQGIFFDEMSAKSEDFDYYKEISDYAKQKGLNFIVLNPGAIVEQSYFDTDIASIIVTRETTYNNALNSYAFNQPSDQTKLGLILYQSSGINIAQNVCEFAKSYEFEYIYATQDGADGNPWDSFSAYLDELVFLMQHNCQS